MSDTLKLTELTAQFAKQLPNGTGHITILFELGEGGMPTMPSTQSNVQNLDQVHFILELLVSAIRNGGAKQVPNPAYFNRN